MQTRKKLLIGSISIIVVGIIVAGIIVALGKNNGSASSAPPVTIQTNNPSKQIDRLSSADYITIYPWMRKLIKSTKKGFKHPEYQLCAVSGSDVTSILRAQCKSTMSMVSTLTTFILCLNAAKGRAKALCAATAFGTLSATYGKLLAQAKRGAALFTDDSACGKLLFHPQIVKKNKALVDRAEHLAIHGGPLKKVSKVFDAAMSISSPTGNQITLKKLAADCKP